MESRKITGSKKNNDAAKIYVVDVAKKVVYNRSFLCLESNRSKTDGKNKDVAGKPFQVRRKVEIAQDDANTTWEFTDTDFTSPLKSVCVEEPETLCEVSKQANGVDSCIQSKDNMENVVPSSEGVYVAAVHNEDNEDVISNQAGNMDDMIGQEAGTLNSNSFSNVLSPNGAADVGGSEATDVDASVIPNGSPIMASALYANPLNSERINFRSLLNEEKVESYDYVLPQDVADVVKTRYENTLVGYFLGKSLAFPIVQNYVNNAWSNFGLQKLMKTDEEVFMFKFASKEGLEKVLQRGPWMIRKSPIILTKWSSILSLKKGEVTSVPVWVKLHGVSILAYSRDGLSLDAFTSSMCKESWGRISFARALIDVNSESDLKTEVIMAIPNEKGDEYTKEVIRVEYEWKPPHCGDCKIFGHDLLHCPKHAAATVPNDPPKSAPDATKSDEDECGTSSSRGNQEEEQVEGTKVSMLNEHVESDDEVDEFIFPEGDKFGDKFDIRLKSRVRK
ncbi:hypothetical protein Tco_0803369 [Tanacetum coccineum]|uniref:DUF4283 domain-containing protein n=1 Tax=Tanacetum coccineum TaxID=301880 RepID=A0ABQ5A3U8_9ASTR